jgi:hypothetical protein
VGIVVALWMTGACDPGATPEDPDETEWGDGYATWSYETKGMRVGCWAKKDLERLCRDLLIIEDIAIHDSPDEYQDTEVVNITLAEDAESGAIVAIKDFDGGAGYGGRSEGGCIERRGEDTGEWDWCDEALERKVLPSPTPPVTPTTRAQVSRSPTPTPPTLTPFRAQWCWAEEARIAYNEIIIDYNRTQGFDFRTMLEESIEDQRNFEAECGGHLLQPTRSSTLDDQCRQARDTEYQWRQYLMLSTWASRLVTWQDEYCQ